MLMDKTVSRAGPLADLAQLPGVPSAVAAATAAVDVVLRDRGLRRVGDQARAEALLASAEASAGLTEDPDRWRAGSVRLAAVPALAGLIRMAPGQALARAHAVVARVVRDEDLGRTSGGCGHGVADAGPGGAAVRPTTAPVVVLGAVVHAEIAVVEAFGAASGLVARAAEHLVLVSGGLDPYAVIVVEAGHAGDPAGYRAGLAATRTGGEVSGVGGGGSSPVPRRSPGARSSRQRPRMERREGGGHDAAPTWWAPCLARQRQVTKRAS